MIVNSISPSLYREFAMIYNEAGASALESVLANDYGFCRPKEAIKRIQENISLGYDPVQDRFLLGGDDTPPDIFLSMEELCSSTDRPVAQAKVPAAEESSAAMEKMIQTLIAERLLELSRYVTLNSMSRSVLVDKTAIEASGFRLVIR